MLALDEPGELDDVHEIDGYRFVIAKDLVKMAGPITVDSSFWGFKLHSNISPGKGSCAR
jgi:hypothetical protein